MFKKIFCKIKLIFKILNNINFIIRLKPKFIFFSENKVYQKYSYLIIEYLSKKYPGEVYYVSSDINDKINDLDVKNFYIGNGILFQYFFKKIAADNLFMTLTDLDNNVVKKNKFVKNYIYFFHGAVSTTKIYTSNAFDNYDTILCNGNYHIKEIEQKEKIDNLKKKKLIKSGFFYFDYLRTKIKQLDFPEEILVAPSWNVNKKYFINENFFDILKNLLKDGHKVRFRPHQEILKRSKKLMNFYKTSFKSKNFIFDDNDENFESLQNAKFLITDNSGISIEFLIMFKRPIIFYLNFEKIHNNKYDSFKNLKPIDDIIKDKFGYQFNNEQISKISLVLKNANDNFDKSEIDNFIKNNFYNFGRTIEFFDKNMSNICY